VNEIPGSPQPNVKDIEAELLLLRRRVRELEARIEALEP